MQLDPHRARAVVRLAIGRPRAEVAGWTTTSMQPGPGRAVILLEGAAREAGSPEVPWRLVAKVVAPDPDRSDPASIHYWPREGLLYESGLLERLPSGIRAPRLYGADRRRDGCVTLWLEHIAEDRPADWPLSRWSLAARHLGRLATVAPDAGGQPSRAWLTGGRLRSWLQAHEARVRRIAAAPDNPEVARWWPRPTVDALLRLWRDRDAYCRALERLPQAFGHGDAIRRNLRSAPGAGGAVHTVAIDWEHAGLYASGEEIGQTLSSAAAFFDVEPDVLPDLDDALYTGYLEGLRDGGRRGPATAVRFAHLAHAALRNAFNAVGTAVPATRDQEAVVARYGRSWTELAERRAALRPWILRWAAEARRLLDAGPA